MHEFLGRKGLTIGGTGSNSTTEAMEATKKAYDFGVRAMLLVEPYYNGPSSLEIRKEYLAPIAASCPEVQIIPYVIPGRSGTQLLPQDVAILSSEFDNIRAIKEATGNLENMQLTRALCGEDFTILSGDDERTFDIIASSEIGGRGVISVASNIAPKATQELVYLLLEGKREQAKDLASALAPLFNIVTIKTDEETSFGSVLCRARNPLPCKTLMNIVGMEVGPCRQPLGKMTKKGITILLEAARDVYTNHPEILTPIEEFFDVDLSRRLWVRVRPRAPALLPARLSAYDSG